MMNKEVNKYNPAKTQERGPPDINFSDSMESWSDCGCVKYMYQTILKELCHDDFEVFGSNCPKLKLSTFVVHKMLIEH